MLLISLSRRLPKLIVATCFIPLIYFIYFVSDSFVDAELRAAVLVAYIGALAWLPSLLDKLGWLELNLRGENIIFANSENSSIRYEKIINFALLFLGLTSISMIYVWKWAVSNVGLNSIAILLLICGCLVFEYSVLEIKRRGAP